jgi:hypothetical protein
MGQDLPPTLQKRSGDSCSEAREKWWRRDNPQFRARSHPTQAAIAYAQASSRRGQEESADDAIHRNFRSLRRGKDRLVAIARLFSRLVQRLNDLQAVDSSDI